MGLKVYRNIRYNISEEESRGFKFSGEYGWRGRSFLGASNIEKVKKALRGLEIKKGNIRRNDGKSFVVEILGNKVRVKEHVFILFKDKDEIEGNI